MTTVILKPLILSLLLLIVPGSVIAQTSKATAKPPSELTKLREEFVKATNDYKASLAKLLPFYESDIRRAEEKLELSRKLLSEGQIPRTLVEENERALQNAKAKIAETKRQLDTADQQIATVLNDTAVEKEFKSAVQQRRRARKPRCSNWTLTAYQRTTFNSVAFGYKIVCQN